MLWEEYRPAAQEAYNERIQEAIAGVDIWNHEVNGYYRSASGRVVTQWPLSMTDFKTMTEKIDADAFDVG